MLHKGKVLVVLLSTLIVLYGVSAAFYGKVVAKDDAYPALSVFMESLKTVNDGLCRASGNEQGAGRRHAGTD